MLFNSFAFLLFFPIAIIGYFLITPKYRWVFLLLCSYFFYGFWKVSYLGLIVISTLIDYWAAINIERAVSLRRKKQFLIVSLLSNLGILFFFKYFNFFSTSIGGVAEFIGITIDSPTLDILLPVGISFYTFQTLSYTIDVYRGTTKAEKHLGIFAVYVSFWPQLVAGPIERSNHLIGQLRKEYNYNYNDTRKGLIRIVWGFFKKLVIADRLGIIVDRVFETNIDLNPEYYWLGALLFAFQIYCDFSGYSDIAIGSARIMGVDLMENFRMPYFSSGFKKFWGRWHISLSTWFRDYVYIPLGGNRVSRNRILFNLLLTFVLSGFWHGAHINFIIWGGIHGLFLVIEKLFSFDKKAQNNGGFNVLYYLLTMFMVLIAWVFFRADSFSSAMNIISGMLAFEGGNPLSFSNFESVHLVMGFLFICILLLIELYLFNTKKQFEDTVLRFSTLPRWGIYISLVLIVLWFGVYTKSDFIYFQF